MVEGRGKRDGRRVVEERNRKGWGRGTGTTLDIIQYMQVCDSPEHKRLLA